MHGGSAGALRPVAFRGIEQDAKQFLCRLDQQVHQLCE
jgi:hypothetical protein